MDTEEALRAKELSAPVADIIGVPGEPDDLSACSTPNSQVQSARSQNFADGSSQVGNAFCGDTSIENVTLGRRLLDRPSSSNCLFDCRPTTLSRTRSSEIGESFSSPWLHSYKRHCAGVVCPTDPNEVGSANHRSQKRLQHETPQQPLLAETTKRSEQPPPQRPNKLSNNFRQPQQQNTKMHNNRQNQVQNHRQNQGKPRVNERGGYQVQQDNFQQRLASSSTAKGSLGRGSSGSSSVRQPQEPPISSPSSWSYTTPDETAPAVHRGRGTQPPAHGWGSLPGNTSTSGKKKGMLPLTFGRRA